jgi:hypothetical protein
VNPLLLFLAFLGAAVPIVAVTTCLAYPDDALARAHFPRRLIGFVASCSALGALLWLLQWLLIDVGP